MSSLRQNILVIRPEKLGDLVVSTPVFRAIRHSFPSAKITVVTDEVYGAILQGDPHVDDVLRVQWKWRQRGQHEPIRSIAQKIHQKGSFDIALVLYPNWWGWNAVCALAGIPRVVQLGGTWLGALLGHQIIRRRAHERQLHYRDYYLEAAAAAGAALPPGDSGTPRVYLDADAKEDFLRRFSRTNTLRRVIVHPFGHGSAPNYGMDAYQKLVLSLAETGFCEVWITGGPAEASAWPVVSHLRVKTDWLGGLSINELMLAISSADLFVGGSTGVLHLAAALDVRTLGLFCPSIGCHPSAWGPLGKHTSWLTVPEELCKGCTPSGSAGCRGGSKCDLVDGLPVDDVARRIRDMIE